MVSPGKGMATGRDGSRPGYGLGEPREASRISMWTGSGTSESSLVPDFESDPESDQATRHTHPGLSRNPGRTKRAIRLHPSVTRLGSPGGTGVQGVGREDVRSTRPRGAGTGSSSASRAPPSTRPVAPGTETEEEPFFVLPRPLVQSASGRRGLRRRRWGKRPPHPGKPWRGRCGIPIFRAGFLPSPGPRGQPQVLRNHAGARIQFRD